MTSRILFFDGPPGSGKSSLSQFVAQQCEFAGQHVHWLEEHDLIDTYLAPFFEAQDGDAAQFVPTLLECWQRLVEHMQVSEDIWCIEGVFHLSTLKLLLAYDIPQADIEDYLQRLYALLTPLKPALLHSTGDVERILRMIIASRGDQWGKNVAGDVNNYPYQQRLGRTGVEGMIRFFVESDALLSETAENYPFAYHRIDTTGRAWKQYKHAVCDWLGVPVTIEEAQSTVDLSQYVGIYMTPEYFPPQFNHPLEVELTPDDGLHLHTVFMHNFRLIPKSEDCFAIAGRSVQMEFVRDDDGAITGAIYPFVPDQRFFCEKVS